jgi:hypothetical protein
MFPILRVLGSVVDNPKLLGVFGQFLKRDPNRAIDINTAVCNTSAKVLLNLL